MEDDQELKDTIQHDNFGIKAKIPTSLPKMGRTVVSHVSLESTPK